MRAASMTMHLKVAVLALLLVGAIAPSAASAFPAAYDGISDDGSVAFFSSRDSLVPGDTDHEEDVYQRVFDPGLGESGEYVTREVSIGPSGGNDTLRAQYDGNSSDGSEVFFSTREQLVAADLDHKEDVYVRDVFANKTTLVSQGDESCEPEGCGDGEVDSGFVPGGAPADGGRLFFATTEKLSSADKDSSLDVYVRDLAAKRTYLVSAKAPSCVAPSCGNEAHGAFFRGTDAGGDLALFTTVESLDLADADTAVDVYAREVGAGTTKLVSATLPGSCPALAPGENCDPTYGTVSEDGSHVFFETNEQISNQDTDASQDVYDWTGAGAAALSSIGPNGGNAEVNVTFAGASSDGGSVYFETAEALDATADTDQRQDVYQRAGGVTTLVSTGPGGRGNEQIPASFEAVPSGPSPAVFISTSEALTAADTDTAQDVYERSGATTTLISTGPEGSGGNVDAAFAGVSADGSAAFFVTTESLLAKDTDSSSDIYVRSAGETALVSTGQVGGNGLASAGLHGVAADGSRAFFVTAERLTVNDDFAGEDDVYSWSSEGTLLVSVANSPDLVLGPPPPALEGTNPVSPGASTLPTVFGQAEAESAIKVYSTFDCSGEPVAQGTAEELSAPGLTVKVAVATGATVSYRATAEADGVVSPCSSAIQYTQKTPDPPSDGGGDESGGGDSGATGTGGTGTATTGSTAGGGSGGTRARPGIVYVAPQTRITFAPASKTRARRPVFRFSDVTGQPGTQFFCRVDKKKWGGCSSPTRVKKLALGRHVFAVKAVNAVGTGEPAPVKHAFKVVR